MHCSLKSLENSSRTEKPELLQCTEKLTPRKRMLPFNFTFSEFGYAGVINQALVPQG